MKNTFSVEQISKTANLGANLISRQQNSDLKASFLETKSINPRLIHDQVANQLGCQVVL